MYPSFDLGPLSFPAYFTLLTIGFMLAIWLAWREAPSVGVDQNDLLDLALIALVMGLVGSRLLHVVADGMFDYYVNLCLDPLKVPGRPAPLGFVCTSDEMCATKELGELCNVATGTCHPGRDCLRAFKLWYGGLTYYGGFLAAFGAGLWFVIRRRLPVWRVADLTGFGIALGLIFGRIGCFLAGCCYGAASDSACALHFPKGSPAWQAHVDQMRDWVTGLFHVADIPAAERAVDRLAQHGLPHSLDVHATQLYEVVTNALVFAVCYWMFKRRRTYDGKVFWWFILLYAVTRFVIEIFRADPRGVWLGDTLSTSQLIGVPLVVLSLVMMWRGRRAARAAAVDAA